MKTPNLDLLRKKAQELKELEKRKEILEEEIWNLEYDSNAAEELEYELYEYDYFMDDFEEIDE